MPDKILGLIPIKTNSKRCKNKNIRMINDKPLFWYAATALTKAKLPASHDYYISMYEWDHLLWYYYNYYFGNYSYTWVNNSLYTFHFDCIFRPKELCEDPTQLKEVCLHALEVLTKKYDTLILIQPSNPFVKPKDIRKAYKLFLDNDRRPVRSVYKTEKRCSKALCLVDSELRSFHFMRLKDIETKGKRFDTYYGNGSIVIVDVEQFLKEKTLLIDGTIGYVMPQKRSLDIDTEHDFKIAKLLLEDKK